MGAPSQSLLQGLSDKRAAYIYKNLAGFVGEQQSATALDLFPQLDASTDPAVIAALAADCDILDRFSLPELFTTKTMPAIFNRLDYGNWWKDLNALVTGPTGGAYASLEAYLEAVSATIDPIEAECATLALGGAYPFNNIGTPGTVTTVNPPNYQARFCDAVSAGADGALSDLTAASQSATTGDMTIWAANTNVVYFGSRYPFNTLALALSPPGSASITPTFQYWNGSAWAALTVTDNTTGFQRNDTVIWATPADWQRTWKDNSGATFPGNAQSLYYIRIVRGNAAGITAPVGTCATIVPKPVLALNGLHYGVDQPPLAILRVDGSSVLHVIAGTASSSYPTNLEFAKWVPSAARLRCLCPPGQNATFTICYVNQAGVVVSQVQTSWTSPAALATKSLALNGSDTGVRAVNGTVDGAHWAITTSATGGVFAFEIPAVRTPAI